MKTNELLNVFAAIIILFAVISFAQVLNENYSILLENLIFSIIIIGTAVFSKKLMAHLLDADAVHKIWFMQRYGYRTSNKLYWPIPTGIILPLVISAFSLGVAKLPAILTYETTAKKIRAAKRFGFYSYTEITEWHNALIGAAGVIGLLTLSFISYFPGFEYLSKIAIYYAAANLLPISKLDGTQIFFGSKILYLTLVIITTIFLAYALLLP